ncbi:MAG: hypothetical protein GC185_08390 [Alphaproteobacteria bacterium]|nr:hypothetical protein [Alphaproteobacteria bacterium]
MHALMMGEEKQAQFESDAAAFDQLRPGQQRAAVFLAKHTFACRQWLVAANDVVMGATDWAYDKLAAAAAVPLKAVKPVVSRAWQGVARRVKSVLPAPNPDSKISRFWRKAKDRIGHIAQKTGEKLGHVLEYHGALGLYRATKWVFDPTTPSGKPLFGHKTVNKVVGTALGVCAFIGFSAWVGWLEVMSKVWHAEVAAAAVKSTAPWLVKLAQQAIAHPVITAGVAVGQFVVVPAIAAARQVLKSTKLAQGIAYQYNRRLRTHRKIKKRAPVTRWKPSTYVANFFQEFVEKSSPEFYKARLRHFEEKWRKRLGRGKPEEPPASPPAPPSGPSPVVSLDAKRLEKNFNKKAAPEQDNAPAPKQSAPGKPDADKGPKAA